MTQHQKYLYVTSQAIVPNTENEMQLIQLTPALMSKCDGNLVILQTTISSNSMSSLEHLIPYSLDDKINSCDKDSQDQQVLLNSEIKTNIIESNSIINYADNIDRDIESNDGNLIDDNHESENEIEKTEETNMNCFEFANFPKQMIKDSRLVFKGKELIELMTKFFKLECDRCK